MNEENAQLEKEVRIWWNRLQHDTGNRSRIRHQSDLIGVQTVGSFYDLVKVLPEVDIDILASIAMVLSHIEVDSKVKVARAMGKKTINSNHVVSELRFNKLISQNLEDFSRELIRVLPLIDNTADVGALAVDLKYWDSPTQISKKNWLSDYYLA